MWSLNAFGVKAAQLEPQFFFFNIGFLFWKSEQLQKLYKTAFTSDPIHSEITVRKELEMYMSYIHRVNLRSIWSHTWWQDKGFSGWHYGLMAWRSQAWFLLGAGLLHVKFVCYSLPNSRKHHWVNSQVCALDLGLVHMSASILGKQKKIL